MYAGRDYSPANVDENEIFGIDFVDDFNSTETILSATWSLTVKTGTDATPSSHLIGISSLQGRTQTSQRISGLVAGVTYIVKCVATTNQGNTYVLYTHIYGEPIT